MGSPTTEPATSARPSLDDGGASILFDSQRPSGAYECVYVATLLPTQWLRHTCTLHALHTVLDLEM